MRHSIESRRDGDEERRARLDVEAFGAREPFDPAEPLVSADRDVCAYDDGGALVAAATTLPGGQFFGRRGIPMGGVGSVAVRADARGRGLARAVMVESLGRMRERGEVISTLYPSTASLYRSLGYEMTGHWVELALPLSALERRGPRTEVDDLPLDDLAALRSVYEAVAPDYDGWLDRDPLTWEYREHQHGKRSRAFNRMGSRDGTPVWAVAYEYRDRGRGAAGQASYDVHVVDMIARDDDATADLLGFLASSSTMAGDLVTTLPAAAWTHVLAHPATPGVRRNWQWMTRLVDVPAALAARGYPAVDIGPFVLEVTDDVLGHNCGTWQVTIREGTPHVDATDAGGIGIDQRVLAAVFTGARDPFAAARQGAITGAAASDLAALRAAFCATTPSCPDFF